MRHEDPEYEIHEELLLASMSRDRELFMAVSALNIKSWFFEERKHKTMFREIKRIVEQRTFAELVPVMLASKPEISDAFKNLMTHDHTIYQLMFAEDDFMFLNMCNIHRDKRRKDCFSYLTRQIEHKMHEGESYSKEFEELKELEHDSASSSDGMTAKQILVAIEEETVSQRFKTGIDCIDERLEITAGSLLVVGGESSSGKTTITNQFLYNFLTTKKCKALYFSLETNQIRLGKRFITHIQTLSKRDRNGAYEDFSALDDRLTIIKSTRDISAIIELSLEAKRRDETNIIVLDYLQLASVDGIYEETPRTGEIITQLQSLAQAHGFLVICLCQLRKENFTVSKGKTTRQAPTMNDLRGSNLISNAADYIIILQHQDVHQSKAGARDINAYVVKSKEGEQFKAPLVFKGSGLTFFDGTE